MFTEDISMPSPGKKSTTAVLPSASGYPCLSQLTPSWSQLATERGISAKKDNYIENRAGCTIYNRKTWEKDTMRHCQSQPPGQHSRHSWPWLQEGNDCCSGGLSRLSREIWSMILLYVSVGTRISSSNMVLEILMVLKTMKRTSRYQVKVWGLEFTIPVSCCLFLHRQEGCWRGYAFVLFVVMWA